MHLLYLWLITALLGVYQPTQPNYQVLPSLCSDCPQQSINFNPYEVPSFFAARFLVKGKLFVPAGSFAECTKGDCQLNKQLRFGSIYLAEGNHNEGLANYPHPIVCKRGKETMVVYIRPLSGWTNFLYDSIPFQPGKYELMELPGNTIVTSPYRMPDGTLMTSYHLQEVSFAVYYSQHEAELQRANPFAGCNFADYKPSAGRNSADYVPLTPADIFRLLLVHKRYFNNTHWKLRPLTRREQRSFDQSSGYH